MEGLELPILQTIPWDKLSISVVGAEVTHGAKGKKSYIDYMAKQGYVMYKHVNKANVIGIYGCDDLMFVKKEIADNLVKKNQL